MAKEKKRSLSYAREQTYMMRLQTSETIFLGRISRSNVFHVQARQLCRHADYFHICERNPRTGCELFVKPNIRSDLHLRFWLRMHEYAGRAWHYVISSRY